MATMNRNLFGFIPGLRLIFLIQFLWTFAYAAGFSSITLFLVKHFGISAQKALILLGIFHLLGAFFGSIIGYIQDYQLGIRRSLYLGLGFSTVGFFIFFFASYTDHPHLYVLYIAFSFIILGKDILGIAIYAILGKTYHSPISLMIRVENLIVIDYITISVGILFGTGLGWLFSSILSPDASIFIAESVNIFTLLCIFIFSELLKKSGNSIDFLPLSRKKAHAFIPILFVLFCLSIFCLIFPQYALWILLVPSIWGGGFFLYTLFYKSEITARYIIFFLCFLVLLEIFSLIQGKTSSLVLSYFDQTLSVIKLPLSHSDFRVYDFISSFFTICSGIFLLLWRAKFPFQHKISRIFFHFDFAVLFLLLSLLLLRTSTNFLNASYHVPFWMILLFSFFWSMSNIIVTCTGVALCIRLLPKQMIATSLGFRRTLLVWPSLFLLFEKHEISPNFLPPPQFQDFFSSEFSSLSFYAIIFFLGLIALHTLFIKLLCHKKHKLRKSSS